MHPKCIILDEPTAMLDPNGRKEVIRAVRALNHAEGITIVLITHYMEEIIPLLSLWEGAVCLIPCRLRLLRTQSFYQFLIRKNTVRQ